MLDAKDGCWKGAKEAIMLICIYGSTMHMQKLDELKNHTT